VTYRTTRFLALAAALTVGATACDQNTTNLDNPGQNPDGPATLKVLLTDAPADYIAGAWVDIGEVQLLPMDGGAPITLSTDGTDGMVNLLDLQDGATTQIAEAEIDAGEYHQLRLIVESAEVELIDGYTFPDGSKIKTLKVPSGAQTGIKLNLWSAESTETDDEDAGVWIIPGETVLVLDFDVNQSFRIQGNPETPAGIKGMHFQPTLRVTARDVAGSISGIISAADDSIALTNLTVTADPTGPATVPGYQTLTATALTDGTGAYTILFLVPGDYDVTVDAGAGFFSNPLSVPVTVGEAEDILGIDFLIDETGSISGTVSDASGTLDVDGITVTADDGSNTLTTTTASDGSYSFGDLLPGDYAVTVDAPAGYFSTPDVADVSVGASEDVVGVDFVLDQAASIAGVVTAADDSIAVNDLTVTATNDADANVEFSVQTGADGTYTLTGVVPGDYTVTVAVPAGFATTPASEAVTVAAGDAVADIDFDVDESGG
jgi:hypothetical protein